MNDSSVRNRGAGLTSRIDVVLLVIASVAILSLVAVALLTMV